MCYKRYSSSFTMKKRLPTTPCSIVLYGFLSEFFLFLLPAFQTAEGAAFVTFQIFDDAEDDIIVQSFDFELFLDFDNSSPSDSDPSQYGGISTTPRRFLCAGRFYHRCDCPVEEGSGSFGDCYGRSWRASDQRASAKLDFKTDDGFIDLTTTTDANGDYSFPSLQPATFMVVVEATGFGAKSETVELLPEKDTVMLAGLDDLTRNFEMDRPARLFGTVADFIFLCRCLLRS